MSFDLLFLDMTGALFSATKTFNFALNKARVLSKAKSAFENFFLQKSLEFSLSFEAVIVSAK